MLLFIIKHDQFSFFYETLERLKLKFPDDLDMNKPFEQNIDKEFEAVINR